MEITQILRSELDRKTRKQAYLCRAQINKSLADVDARFYDADPNLFIKQYGVKDFILYVGHIGWGRKNLLSLPVLLIY